jgi:hypothetical protein
VCERRGARRRRARDGLGEKRRKIRHTLQIGRNPQFVTSLWWIHSETMQKLAGPSRFQYAEEISTNLGFFRSPGQAPQAYGDCLFLRSPGQAPYGLDRRRCALKGRFDSDPASNKTHTLKGRSDSEPPPVVCVECLVGEQNEPTLFKVTEPSSVPYRAQAPSACAKGRRHRGDGPRATPRRCVDCI